MTAEAVTEQDDFLDIIPVCAVQLTADNVPFGAVCKIFFHYCLSVSENPIMTIVVIL